MFIGCSPHNQYLSRWYGSSAGGRGGVQCIFIPLNVPWFLWASLGPTVGGGSLEVHYFFAALLVGLKEDGLVRGGECDVTFASVRVMLRLLQPQYSLHATCC